MQKPRYKTQAFTAYSVSILGAVQRHFPKVFGHSYLMPKRSALHFCGCPFKCGTFLNSSEHRSPQT